VEDGVFECADDRGISKSRNERATACISIHFPG
jgi:hypothetical protein